MNDASNDVKIAEVAIAVMEGALSAGYKRVLLSPEQARALVRVYRFMQEHNREPRRD